MIYRPDTSRVTTGRASRSGLSRFSALLALVALVVGMFVTTESPALAVAYTYTFNNGGGGNTPTGGTQEEGTAISFGPGTAKSFPRSGYTLQGVRSSHDQNIYGVLYPNNAFVLTDFTMPSQNVVFTAVWSLNITYDSQGGSAIADGDTTTTNGATITTLPTDPTRAGYTFAGWYTTSSGGSQITTSAPHGQTSHFTLYAKWTGNPLAISYDSQGGSAVADGDTTSSVGGLINPLPTPPTRTGFSFTGWNTSADGTGVDVGVIVLPLSDGPAHGQSADFTLYAQWTGNPLNISYDSQSGTAVADGDTTTSSGATITTLPTDPTRAGYTFAGWYTASSGGTQITASAPTVRSTISRCTRGGVRLSTRSLQLPFRRQFGEQLSTPTEGSASIRWLGPRCGPRCSSATATFRTPTTAPETGTISSVGPTPMNPRQ